MTKTIETQIGGLYALPLSEFVSARQALAKTLKGEDARRVKALVKPTTLPWIVNQVHWHDPDLYQRLLKSGAALRIGQIAALEGRGAKVREMATAHKRVVAEAVEAGVRHASAAGVSADAEALLRMFENVSLAEQLPQPHGQLTTAVEPAGFEILRGIAVKPALPPPLRAVESPRLASNRKPAAALDPAAVEKQQRLERERAEAAQRRALAIAEAETRLAAARRHETEAREAWHRAKDVAEAAERDLFAARRTQ